MAASDTLLDEVLPHYDRRTAHGRPVDASLDAVAAAIRATDLREAKLARTLLGVRTLGRSVRQGGALGAVGDGVPGFLPLASGPHEVVVGFVGRPWPGGAPVVGVADRDAFLAYVPVDAVRVAMSIRCETATYGTLLVTETRIEVGPLAARPFGRYWRVVRAGSDAVRGSLLRAVARRAEQAA